jgi:hypothetical protein
MRLQSVILTSLSLGWLALMGCSNSPYLRDVQPAYDAHGNRLPEHYTIPKPYMEHLLKDLKACYREEQ